MLDGTLYSEGKGPRVEINSKEKTVHVNRLKPLLGPDLSGAHSEGQWSPPLFHGDHMAPVLQQKPLNFLRTGLLLTSKLSVCSKASELQGM